MGHVALYVCVCVYAGMCMCVSDTAGEVSVSEADVSQDEPVVTETQTSFTESTQVGAADLSISHCLTLTSLSTSH